MAKLVIDIKSKSANLDNARAIVNNLFKIVPYIASTFKVTSVRAARLIAPQGPRQLGQFHRKRRKPENISESIVDSIFIRGEAGDTSFILGAENNFPDGVKVIMQEYGYPYDTTEDSGDDDDEDNGSGKNTLRRGFKPYPPNPKNSPRYKKLENASIRGVGYLRAGLVAASKQLAYGGSENRLPLVSKGDVLNYEAVVKRNLEVAIRKFVTDYAKGKVNFKFIPYGSWMTNYSSGDSKIELFTDDINYEVKTKKSQFEQFTPISKYASKFGTVTVDFDGLLGISSNFGPFSTSTLGGDTSFTGRPKAGRRDFLI